MLVDLRRASSLAWLSADAVRLSEEKPNGTDDMAIDAPL
jgi:hypothetical protein